MLSNINTNKFYEKNIKFFKKIYSKVFPSFLKKFIRNLLILRNNNLFILNKNSFCEDGMATNHLTDFIKDEKFNKAYFDATKNNELKFHPGEIRFRAYVVNYFANYALNKFDNQKKSNFVELGTGKGIMAKIITSNTKLLTKKDIKFYLFDTFKGIPFKNLTPNEHNNALLMNKEVYNCDYFKFVKEKFINCPNVELVRGILPESIIKYKKIENIIFLHVDLNNAYSEIKSIEYLYDNLSVGAVVILDDYCYSENFRKLKNEWDNFIVTKNNEILSLPTGQGIFFKI